MNRIIYISVFFLFALVCNSLTAQKQIGSVYEINDQNKKTPLIGANVYWLETMQGTATDLEGNFELEKPAIDPATLIISFIGYFSDTLIITKDQNSVDIVLVSALVNTLGEAVITGKRPDKFISRLNPIYTEVITTGELQKAACCNLSESFETNASVDVSYSDAITGAKTIQLLGLAGVYSQLMSENFPNLRGLASTYGLGYIPGPWMESIQVSKGTSSVVNGYESITGQINIEYKKPNNSEKVYINGFVNDKGRVEGNLNTSLHLNENWSTMIFGHFENGYVRHDNNHDSFMDEPQIRQINFFNRWEHSGVSPWHFQTGFKILDEERTGGQMAYRSAEETNQYGIYGIDINTNRYEAFAKLGYIFPERKNTSIGFINNFTHHTQHALFGKNLYEGEQVSWYSNLIFDSYLLTLDHSFKTGLSFSYDDYDEVLNDSSFTSKELVPGIFAEYTYEIHEKFTLLAGLRLDIHSIYGPFFTPRLHLKYHPDEHTTIRASAGKGYRTANIIAENSQILATSRKITVLEELRQEEAWNYGINLTRHFEAGKREITLSAEFYRTQFKNQIILDMDQNIERVYIYNLTGCSFSNNYQIELTFEPIDRLDVSLAYRYTDVRMTINQELIRKPLVHRYKGLLTLSYKTRLQRWQFDLTTQLNGDSRLPATQNNPPEYRRDETSPVYTIINAQVSKFFKIWDIYVGVENLTNYKQKDPVIGWDDPFGEYFDASRVWGPIIGRKIYLGFRFKI